MNAFIILVVLSYNFALIAGACYLVQFHDWSLWTIFFALCLIVDYSNKTTKDENGNNQ